MEMAALHLIKVLEHSRVAPPPGSASEASFPLTFFDVIWVALPPVERLFFYEFPDPKNTTTAHFLNSLLPHLKHSLSLSLQLFYPLAGNLTLSPQTGQHDIRYVDGDNVSLTVAESAADFHLLVADHPKDASHFHPLVSPLPASALLAVQLTVFPNSGLCIGISLHHVIADGRSLAHFMKSWAFISRTGHLSSITSLPFFDRSKIEDRRGLKKTYLLQMAEMKVELEEDLKPAKATTQLNPNPHPNPNPLRATFILGRAQIERLRQWVVTRRPELPNCTPFVLTCAHVWVCLVRARGDVVGGKTVHFIFPMDCRARLDPPVPDTYFGNCIGLCFAEAKGSVLAKEDGLATASELIGGAIAGLRNGVLSGSERWLEKYVELVGKRIVAVAGSPKFRVYDTDFGWGMPRKTEVLSIERTGAVYLGDSRYEEGGTEVGLVLPKGEMDRFACLFQESILGYVD